MRFASALVMAAMLSFSAPAYAEDYVVMKVNNQDITASQVQLMLNGLFPESQAPAFDTIKPDLRDKLLRGMMAEKLLYGEAVKQGIDKSEKMTAELEAIRKKLIVRILLDAKTSDSITESDLKSEYDAVIAAMGDEKEVRARHILVPSEAEAKDVKKKLDAGKSFEEVARDYSKDSGSAKQGGDLGYFTKDKMVKEFAEVSFGLKKGEVSGPVKSPFGWHIIKVEDSRKVAVPTFAEMKEKLRGSLQERKLNDYVSGLVKSADVKLLDSKGKEIPFEKNPGSDKPLKTEKQDKPAEKTEKPSKLDAKTEKTEKLEKTEKTEKTEKLDKSEEKLDKPEKSAEKTEKSEKAN
jgi:peptidyl-prolyl cis-trans isomerase C